MKRGTRLRMSKQEVKDEHKQTEGSPELKAAVRRRQHEVLRASARAAVAEATVVLTNPTHFAVALRYKPETDGAPIVVARGRGRSEEHTSELQSLMRISYAVFCLKKKKKRKSDTRITSITREAQI